MMHPVAFRFDGKAMVPATKFHATRAAKQFEPGRTYVLVVNEARPPESHNHYFAALHQGWLNLAEEYAEQFPTAESLRAYALVKGGFSGRHIITCATHDDALRTAAIAASREKIRIIDIDDCTVTVWVPDSQSKAAMGKEKFEASKRAVLDIVAAMARTTRQDLEANAGKAC